MRSIAIIIVYILLFSGACNAQENVITPDFLKIINEDGWKIKNRNVNLLKEEGDEIVYLDSKSGDGVVWFKNLDFNNGIIEIDIKGKDVQGNSFVGIAFRGTNDSTYDAIYFRPFNFFNKDLARKSHSVQYISYPYYTWEKLRNDFPGKYERNVNPVPDPNSFFHAKIVIRKPKVSVFINNNPKPSLTIEELSDRKGGLVGLWVGNYSDGYFKNLKITKKN